MRDSGGGSAAALAVMAGAGLLGLSPLAVRLSELGPQATGFWRFAFALPILLVLARGKGPSPSGRQIGLLLLAGVFFGLDIALWSAALSFTTVANATLMSNMTPVFAAAFAWFVYKERFGAAVLMGGLTALVGAVTLALARAQTAAGPAASAELGWLGDGLGVASAFWYAGYLLIVRSFGGNLGAGSIIFWATLGAAGLALVATFVMGEALLATTWQGWAVLIGNGVIVQAAGQGLIVYGVGRLPIAISTVLLWLQPLAATVFAWILFGERLGPLAFAGAALILGGVWFVQRAREREAKA